MRSGIRTRRAAAPWTALTLAAAIALIALSLAVAGRGTPATRGELARDIAAQLRCPVCTDLSAADSPSPVAQQMRAQIRTELARGLTARQIRDRFVSAYGPSVLMAPPHHGLSGTAYALPVVLLAAALVTTTLVLRRWRGRAGPEEVG